MTPRELRALRKLADTFLDLKATGLKKARDAGEIVEVKNDGEEEE